MNARIRLADIAFRLRWAIAPARRRLSLFWYRADREAMVFVLVVGAILAGFALVLHATFAHRDAVRERALQVAKRELDCLARNVYFEARGEPEAGQYAVAEVTMNRKASGRFPDSVCAVVYQKSWDVLRRRFVGAFSWTEVGDLPAPGGADWERARKVAQDVYFGRRAPQLQGALYYHSISIAPAWAKQMKLVARIGGHDFYR
jgi:spore germination cell wall hydrolase CwlJ-like protein